MSIVLAVLVGAEAIALVETAFAPEFPQGPFYFQAVASNIFLALAPFSPLLVILILYSWVGKLLLKTIGRYDAKEVLAARFQFLSQISRSLPVSWDGSSIPLLGRPFTVLAISVMSSCVLAFTPYRPDINLAGIPIGIDTPTYILWVNQMLHMPFPDAVAYAFSGASRGDRPLSLLLPYVISSLFRVQGDIAVKFYPLFLAPLLVVSSFLFVYLGHGDKHTAGLVGLMTAFSFEFTVGMWAGYYANWMALAESYLFLGILLRFSASRSKTSLIGLVVLSLMLLFTHPWTWDLMLVLSVSFMIERSVASHDFRSMKITALFVAVNGAADSLKSFALSSYGGGRAGVDIATSSLGFSQLVALWPNIVQIFTQYYSMLLADAVTLGLAAMAIWRLTDARQGFARLVVLWVVLASLPFPFLESLLQSRIIYLLPVPVLASGALIGIQRLGEGRTQRALVLLLVILFSANHALSSMLQL